MTLLYFLVLAFVDLTAADILPCYAEGDDLFWLFMVTDISKEPPVIEGRWLIFDKESNGFIYSNRDVTSPNCVVRLGKELNALFVLPKHNIIAKVYRLSKALWEMLEREVLDP